MRTFGEEVGSGSILSHVKVTCQLTAGFEPPHSVIVHAIVSEENDASGFQHLRGERGSDALLIIKIFLWSLYSADFQLSPTHGSGGYTQRGSHCIQNGQNHNYARTVWMLRTADAILSGWMADSTKMSMAASTHPSGTLSCRSSRVRSHWKTAQRSGWHRGFFCRRKTTNSHHTASALKDMS